MKPAIAILFMFTALTKMDVAKAQNNSSYIDSISRYSTFVDSSVSLFYSDVTSRLNHSISHYVLANGKGGGSTDLYRDSSGHNILQMYYYFLDDGLVTEKTYYFIKRKIVMVLVRTDNHGLHQLTKKIYKNERLVLLDNLFCRKQRKRADLDLRDGYHILSRI